MKNTIRQMMAALCLFVALCANANENSFVGITTSQNPIYTISSKSVRSTNNNNGVTSGALVLPKMSSLGGSMYNAPVTIPFSENIQLAEPNMSSNNAVVRPWREGAAGSHDDDPGEVAPIGEGWVMALLALIMMAVKVFERQRKKKA